MAAASPVSPPARVSCSREGTPWPSPAPTPFFGQTGEAKGEVLKWEKEEREEEEEEAAPAPAPAKVAMRKKTLNSPTSLQSLRRRARVRGPVEVKEELHPLQNR